MASSKETAATSISKAPHAICIVASVVLFVIGCTVGVMLDPHLPTSLSSSKKAYQSGFLAAKTLAEKSAMVNGQQIIRSLTGTVTQVQGNTVTLHTQNPNPFDDPSLETRTVDMNAQTSVSVFTQGGSKVATSTPKTKGTTTAPSSITLLPLTKGQISDIHVGDKISVFASEANIKTLKEIHAQVIQVLHTVAK